jgi:hypothetical protein
LTERRKGRRYPRTAIKISVNKVIEPKQEECAAIRDNKRILPAHQEASRLCQSLLGSKWKPHNSGKRCDKGERIDPLLALAKMLPDGAEFDERV